MGNFFLSKGMVADKMEGGKATSIGIKGVERNGRKKGRSKEKKRGLRIKAYFTRLI